MRDKCQYDDYAYCDAQSCLDLFKKIPFLYSERKLKDIQ